MDLTQMAPRSPHFYKTVSSIGVTAVGAMLLMIVVLQFSESTAGLDRLVLGVITLGTAAIGFAYFRQRDALNQMEGKISDELVLRLRHTANAMACSGYMICIFAMALIHRH